jgi:hypothetical protein
MTTALVVSFIAVTISAVTLLWSAASFYLSGVVVKVYVHVGVRSPGQILQIPYDDDCWQKLTNLMKMHPGEPVLIVTAANSGRQRTSVNSAKLVWRGGGAFQMAGEPSSPPAGAWLEAMHSLDWYIPLSGIGVADEAFASISSDKAPARALTAVVELGTGKSVKSRTTITLP